jgi:hypothetical protein
MIRGAMAALASLLALCGASGCELDNPPVARADLSYGYFTCAVQPVLDRECAFPGCHGNPDRGLPLLSPSRMRLTEERARARATLDLADIEAGYHPPLTEVELTFNYQACGAFVARGAAAGDSALLSRPLAVGAGGRYHAPQGDVFAATDAPGYQTLARWIAGANDGDCP